MQSSRYACPQCRRAARLEGAAYVCRACERRYPIGRGYASFLLAERISSVNQDERRHRELKAREYERDKLEAKGRLYFRLHKRLVCALLEKAPPGPLLDAGCGTGLITQDLCGLGREITALDFSEASLEVLHEKRLREVTPVLASLTAIPATDDSFAAILCSGVLQALPGEERALAYAEFARCLQPRGMLVVVAWNAAHFRAQGEPECGVFENGMAYFSFTRDALLREAQAAGFADIVMRPLGLALQIKVLPAGRYVFPVLGKLLHPVEGWVHDLLPTDRDYASEYWLMAARKPR